MSVATDTFAGFVDHLTEALAASGSDDDAATAPGHEWAARLGFSRFHFDRMIRSVAGSRRRRSAGASCSSGRPTG